MGAALVAVHGSGQADPVVPSPARVPDAAPAAAGSDGGLLFRAERAEATVFVYGTVHMGAASFYPLSPPVLSALRRSQALLVEVDVLAADLPQQFRRHGLLPDGAPSLAFTEADAARIDPMLRAAQIDPVLARRFKPDVLAATLVALSARELGLSTAYSVESFLLGFAGALGIAVIELEGLAAQLCLNDDLPESERRNMLGDVLRALTNGGSQRSVARIIKAWQQHDLGLLEATLDPAERGDTSAALHEQFTRQMVTRNAAMVGRIVALGATHQRLFTAVGVLHLPGAQGLPQLLERQGFRITRLL